MTNLSFSLVSPPFVDFLTEAYKIFQRKRYSPNSFIIGTAGINWVSEDCGANIKALNSGKKIQEFMFHPTQRSWALAASWTSCAEFDDEPCRIYKELYYTKDVGEEMNYITNYVFDFEWGQSPLAKDTGIVIPDERIFITRDDTNTKHQLMNKKLTWSTNVDLYYSDDFFKSTPILALEHGNTIIKTPQYMFVSCAYEDQVRVSVYTSTFRSGFADLKKARLPRDAILTTTFTLMDTSEDQVFLYLENKGQKTPFGNLYISDEGARSFSLSIENVIKGNAVDFERVTSLDGTFIANKFYSGNRKDFINHKRMTNSKIREAEWSESDMIAEEEKKAGRSRMSNGNINKKQQETNQQVFSFEESIPTQEVEQHVRTMITHNKGGKWELIKAPDNYPGGRQSTKCYLEDGCSLHLEIYSHQGELAPVYSTEKAVGIVLGTGNMGKRLTENESSKQLFLSRDGGLNWEMIRRGVYIYEIGDHGAIIVIAKKREPTDHIEFSWDEGQTWEKLVISDRKMMVENIIIEPNSISQQFMVYGTYATILDEDADDEIDYD